MKFPSTFQIIPVLDLMGGVAVHAIAGRRHEYREVDGVLGRGNDPVALAMAMTRRCGTRRIYVADLDAIGGLPGHLDVVTDLVGHGLDVWLDAGIAGPNDAMPWLEAFESLSLVLGLETISGHEALAATSRLAPERMVFSLDLDNGVPRMAGSWGTTEPEDLFRLVAEAEISRCLAIDLVRVGTESGPWATGLVSAWRRSGSFGNLFAGGGVRDASDITTLADAGFSGALVATALHRDTLT